MKIRTEGMEIKIETQRIVASRTLKTCTLCGALNIIDNRECFVCRWRGRFDEDPAQIEEGVNQLLARSPDLAAAMIENAADLNRRRGPIRRFFATLTTFVRYRLPWRRLRGEFRCKT